MNDQLWLPFIDWDRPTQPEWVGAPWSSRIDCRLRLFDKDELLPGPEYERDLYCVASLPEPDDSPAYQRFGFVVKDVPRGLAPSLRWMHWTRR